jgi:3'-phosphoadenosine 5'-phosphosulfate sulfotransferase (PAPS reductase)/FAD synthetase
VRLARGRRSPSTRRPRQKGRRVGPRVITVPDLLSYDVIEISSSAGKDSLAMIAYVCALCAALGILDRVVVVHADLGRFEWPGTKEIAEAQAKHFGVRFVVVKRPQGDFFDLVRHYGHWPKPKTRFCTAMLKRDQILRALTRLAAEVRPRVELVEVVRKGKVRRVPRPVRVLNCIGLRAQESPGRAAKEPLTPRGRGTSGRQIVDVWLPIQEMTTEEVFAACARTGAPMHPAYAAGLPRASCVMCFYAPRAALIRAGRLHPELLAEGVALEKEIGHDFRHRLPLLEIQQAIAAGEEPEGPIESWCM